MSPGPSDGLQGHHTSVFKILFYFSWNCISTLSRASTGSGVRMFHTIISAKSEILRCTQRGPTVFSVSLLTRVPTFPVTNNHHYTTTSYILRICF